METFQDFARAFSEDVVDLACPELPPCRPASVCRQRASGGDVTSLPFAIPAFSECRPAVCDAKDPETYCTVSSECLYVLSIIRNF